MVFDVYYHCFKALGMQKDHFCKPVDPTRLTGICPEIHNRGEMRDDTTIVGV
jgi:hypothetical protein